MLLVGVGAAVEAGAVVDVDELGAVVVVVDTEGRTWRVVVGTLDRVRGVSDRAEIVTRGIAAVDVVVEAGGSPSVNA